MLAGLFDRWYKVTDLPAVVRGRETVVGTSYERERYAEEER